MQLPCLPQLEFFLFLFDGKMEDLGWWFQGHEVGDFLIRCPLYFYFFSCFFFLFFIFFWFLSWKLVTHSQKPTSITIIPPPYSSTLPIHLSYIYQSPYLIIPCIPPSHKTSLIPPYHMAGLESLNLKKNTHSKLKEAFAAQISSNIFMG